MTRDFNKPRRERNDMRPYDRRQQPSSRSGEEHSARPGRPRLNRETVDRAWENGAPTKHADYHPRNTGNAPRSGRPYSQTPRPSGSNGRYSNRREDDYNREPDRYERRPNPNSYSRTPGNRSRSYNPRERNFADQSYGERREYGSGSRPGYRGNNAGHYNSHNTGPYNDRAPRGRYDERKEQGYTSRYEQQGNRDARLPRYTTREQRPYRGGQQYESQETRRPYRRNNSSNEHEQFEGDYEQFGAREHLPAPHRSERRQPEEKHVTRLPDGRVLKGPRPAQRKNARFWTEVGDHTDELVQQVHTEPETTEQPADGELEAGQKQPKARATRKIQKSAEGTPAREKKAGTKKRAASSTSSNAPRPSRRGFKWPTS